jgi:hypothetical protein
MSVEQLESAIKALPPAERARFVEWFDGHRHELVAEADNTSPEVRAELELLEPFEEADVERMIQDTVNAHAKKSSARQR